MLPAAERATRDLFGKFAVKMADLLRYEAGLPVQRVFANTSDWDRFAAARAQPPPRAGLPRDLELTVRSPVLVLPVREL